MSSTFLSSTTDAGQSTSTSAPGTTATYTTTSASDGLARPTEFSHSDTPGIGPARPAELASTNNDLPINELNNNGKNDSPSSNSEQGQHPTDKGASINSGQGQQPAGKSSPINSGQGQQPAGKSSPNIIPPARQQVENSAQPTRTSAPTTQQQQSPNLSGQASRPDAFSASDTPTPHLPSGVSRTLMPPSAPHETAGPTPSTGVPASVLPTSLETFVQGISSPFPSQGSEQLPTLASVLLVETASNSALASATPVNTPVGSSHENSDHAGPTAAPESHESDAQLSPWAIAGIAFGSVAGLAIAIFIFWLVKRRSRWNCRGSITGPGDEDAASRDMAPAYTAFTQKIGKVPSASSHSSSFRTSISRDPSTRAYHAAPDMAEQQVRSVSPAAHFRHETSHHQILQPTTAAQIFSESHLDRGHQRDLAVGQNQDRMLNSSFDSNGLDAPMHISSLPPTALSFGAQPTSQLKRDADAMTSQNSTSQGWSPNATSDSKALPAPPQFAHRESIQSLEFFPNTRDGFRSNPFDLEFEGPITRNDVSVPVPPSQFADTMPYGNNIVSSASSSRYPSGVNANDWNAPQESRPHDHAVVATGPTQPPFVWDRVGTSHAMESVDLEQQEIAEDEPHIIVGQAL
ncbi:hypothetical protein E4U09_006183 [Claviceps aff. purpurea]|uniref:Uncharacterized protein n=1 Tax=Claviceps aff. purpurea TaxID=1967640 RepID=A0A9P7U8H4_9HYPO|nr:hypothetical protein E4U09_006183 [Claviceps aff. purpurea]